MSFERIKNICLGMVIGAVAGLLLFAYFKPPKTIIKTEVEEVIVRDTIIVLKPTEIERRIVDTLYVAVRDTIVRNDTHICHTAEGRNRICRHHLPSGSERIFPTIGEYRGLSDYHIPNED